MLPNPPPYEKNQNDFAVDVAVVVAASPADIAHVVEDDDDCGEGVVFERVFGVAMECWLVTKVRFLSVTRARISDRFSVEVM